MDRTVANCVAGACGCRIGDGLWQEGLGLPSLEWVLELPDGDHGSPPRSMSLAVIRVFCQACRSPARAFQRRLRRSGPGGRPKREICPPRLTLRSSMAQTADIRGFGCQCASLIGFAGDGVPEPLLGSRRSVGSVDSWRHMAARTTPAGAEGAGAEIGWPGLAGYVTSLTLRARR